MKILYTICFIKSMRVMSLVLYYYVDGGISFDGVTINGSAPFF